MRQIVVIADNLRSTFNVGSLLRTAEGLAVSKVYLCGYTPYPKSKHDQRLPYISEKIDKQIHKTALGAERLISVEHEDKIENVLNKLKDDSYTVLALEQSNKSIMLNEYVPTEKIAIVLGNEVDGIQESTLKLCDGVLEIPMLGSKESYNVIQAAAMALFHIRFSP